MKHKVGKYGFDNIHYNIFEAKNGKIYMCEKGLLCNKTHIGWDEIFEYLDDIGYKIVKKDE